MEKHNYAHDKVRKKMTSYHGEIKKFEEEEEDVESEEEQENEDDNKEENDWEIFAYDVQMNEEERQEQEEEEQEIPVIGDDGNDQQDEAPRWISPRLASVPQMRKILQEHGKPISDRATRDDVRFTYENAYRGAQGQVNQENIGLLVKGRKAVSYDDVTMTAYDEMSTEFPSVRKCYVT